jgi:hypothetical protein
VRPQLFSLIAAAAPGTLGDRTYVSDLRLCPVCQGAPEQDVITLDYLFDYWDGQDFVEATGCFAVSERLRDALAEAALTGFRTRGMFVSTADYFAIGDDAYARELPTFYEFMFEGEAEGPEIWFRSGDRCAECAWRPWYPTDEGIDAIMRPASDPDFTGVPVEVYVDSWGGEDAFRIQHSTRVVTERFVAVLEKLNVKDMILRPALWVER